MGRSIWDEELPILIAGATKEFLAMVRILRNLDGSTRRQNTAFSPLLIVVALRLITDDDGGSARLKNLRFLSSYSNRLVSEIWPFVFTGGVCGLDFSLNVWYEPIDVDSSLIVVQDAKMPGLSLAYRQVETAFRCQSPSSAAAFFVGPGHYLPMPPQPKDMVTAVNFWAQRKTKNLAKDVLPADSVGYNSFVVAASACHFEGSWAANFNASETRDYNFYIQDGEEPVKVPFMTSSGPQLIASFKGFKVLGIPCKEDDGNFSMYIFLPNAKDGIDYIIKEVISSPDFVLEHYLPSELVEVGEFRIPRFKISFGFEKPDALNWSRLRDIFLPISIDELSDMMKNSAAIREKGHPVQPFELSTFLKLSSRKASSAFEPITGFQSALIRRKADFVADHPFLFLIREDTTGLVVFIGQVVDPRSG